MRFLPLGLACFAALLDANAASSLRVGWTNNFLTITGKGLSGDAVKINYLEAFCRRGSTHREWGQTVLPQRTELVSADRAGKHLVLKTHVEPGVEVLHDIRAGADDVDFRLTLRNTGSALVDVDWFQPCLRVDAFTGGNQDSYVSRCFIFTERGLVTLDRTRRTEDALYRGGQVYVPEGIDLNDVNPRPISPDRPINGLIGCFSADNRYVLAMVWDHTQELFQGVVVCIHNDPRVGGLKAGETKTLHGKIYHLRNDPEALLERYAKDFPPR